MNKPKVLFMPHANLEYSQLNPARRGWVAEQSYAPLFDLVERTDGVRIAFEASGTTLEILQNESPAVLEKLKRLVKSGKVEAVGSPYTHINLANVQPEVGLATLKDGIEAWERLVDVRPRVGWSPECSWAAYIPDIFKEAGFEAFIMDGDSFLLSFQEVREATGLTFDVAGHSNKNHLFKIEQFIKDKPQYLKYMVNPSRHENGLVAIFRSDMMSNLMLWYLMGATEGYRSEPVGLNEIQAMMTRWKDYALAHGSYTMPYAEDAEYIGTTAYFYVKQFNQARFFEPEPASVARFADIMTAAANAGFELSTPSDIIATAGQIIDNPYFDNVENGVAWHGGTSKAWANTTYSRIMDPVCQSVFDGVKTVMDYLKRTKYIENDDKLREAQRRVIAAYVSDSRWPPAPTSPGRFNVKESLDNLTVANEHLRRAMQKHGIAEKRGLYSPELMKSQIEFISRELMAMRYFGEQ